MLAKYSAASLRPTKWPTPKGMSKEMSGVKSGASCERNQSRLNVIDVLFIESPSPSSISVCTRFPVSFASSNEQLGTLLKDWATTMEAATRNRVFIQRVEKRWVDDVEARDTMHGRRTGRSVARCMWKYSSLRRQVCAVVGGGKVEHKITGDVVGSFYYDIRNYMRTEVTSIRVFRMPRHTQAHATTI